MAVAHKTPGVYVEEIPKFPPSIAAVATAIPVFIGYTQKVTSRISNDLILKPRRVTSLSEYEKLFGKAQNEENFTVTIVESTLGGATTVVSATADLAESERSRHSMYYSLQLFYANGGGPCYIVSVGKYKQFTASGKPAVPLLTELMSGLEIVAEENEPTLIVIPEAQWLARADYKILQNAALSQCSQLSNRFSIMDLHGGDVSMSSSSGDIARAVASFRDQGIGNDNLAYGAVYAPNIQTTLQIAYAPNKVRVVRVVDGVPNAPVSLRTLRARSRQLAENCAAALAKFPCVLPPSGAIAGVYASVDRDRGVWKAPANVCLAAVVKPTVSLTDDEQEQMNIDSITGKSVNAIRAFAGRGTLIWGARTLAGNDDEWRYISVRRFFGFVEASVRKETEQFVFEPNVASTWVRVQGMIEDYLTTLWRQGALQGIKPEHAFYVSVGLGTTMTSQDILDGLMKICIGLSVVRPAEFLEIVITMKMNHD